MIGCVESLIRYKVPGARGVVTPLYKHIDSSSTSDLFLFFFFVTQHFDENFVVYMYDQFGSFFFRLCDCCQVVRLDKAGIYCCFIYFMSWAMDYFVPECVHYFE
jgi:hypothetical protein